MQAIKGEVKCQESEVGLSQSIWRQNWASALFNLHFVMLPEAYFNDLTVHLVKPVMLPSRLWSNNPDSLSRHFVCLQSLTLWTLSPVLWNTNSCVFASLRRDQPPLCSEPLSQWDVRENSHVSRKKIDGRGKEKSLHFSLPSVHQRGTFTLTAFCMKVKLWSLYLRFI